MSRPAAAGTVAGVMGKALTEYVFSGYEGPSADLTRPEYRRLRRVAKERSRPGDAPSSEFADLEWLRPLRDLESVDLGFESTVGDVSAAADLPALRELMLGEVTGSLEPLTRCKGLRALGVKGPKVRSLDAFLPLAAQLEVLDLSQTELASLDGIEAFTALRSLDVSQTALKALPLGALTGLTALTATHLMRLSSVAPLASLTRLTKLDLSWSVGVESIAPLAGLEALETLSLTDLKRVPAGDFDALAGLTAMRELTLWGTRIESLAPLEKMTRLTSLTVLGCGKLPAEELYRVVPRLPALETVHVNGGERRKAALKKLAPHLNVFA